MDPRPRVTVNCAPLVPAPPATTSPSPPRGAFARVGAFCVRRRGVVLAAWLAALIGLGMLAPRLAALLTPGGFEIHGSDSHAVPRLTLERFANEYPSGLTAVIEVDPGVGDPDLVRNAAVRRVRAAAADPLVGRVFDARIARDGRAAAIPIGLSAGLDDVLPRLDPLLERLRAASGGGAIVRVTGGGAIFRDFDAVNEADLRRAEMIQAPLVLLILLLVMGSLISAAIPLLASAAALVATLGALWFVAKGMDVTIYVRNIVPLVGIGVSVDYSLFMVMRFREELAAGRDPGDAVVATVATAGRAVFFSGVTVIVALAGMLAVRVPIFTSFAIGATTVVAFAVATALTLVPAGLALLGSRLAPRTIAPRTARRLDRARLERWTGTVIRHPARALTAGTLLLLVLAAPVVDMRLGSSGSSAIPKQMPSIQAAQTIARAAGPGAVAPVRVLVDGGARPPDPATVERLRAQIAADPAVITVTAARPSDDRRLALFETVSAFHEDDTRSHALVTRIRERIAPQATVGSGVRVLLGGGPAQNRDFIGAVSSALPVVIAIVMLLTFAVLVVLFRSVVLPLKAVLMTLLSALAAYGVLVAVFQWGWFAGLVGADPLGHVTAWVPPFLFCMLFGLSMDYEVFLLTRIRERLDVTGDQREAIAWGVARSGRIITAAAAIMVTVFLCFVTNRLVPVKEAALGMAVAVLIDATVVRLVLVPAFMTIAGRWNWWLPPWLARLLPAAPAEPAPATR